MGSNKNCLRQKCGDIFLNINKIKNKAKVFTFHCTLCSIDCDQLKKFSKHLESHLEFFQNQLCDAVLNEDNNINKINLYLEADDIKVETESDDLVNDNGENNFALCADDPLGMEKLAKTELDLSRNIKSEEYTVDEMGNEVETCFEMSVNVKEAPAIVEEEVEYTNATNSQASNEFSSDGSIESSVDSDFVIERTLKTFKNSKVSSTKTKPKTLKNEKSEKIKIASSKKLANCDKPKRRRRVIIESILPFLIQQYKKYEILWQVDDLAFGIKIKRHEIYTKIAESLKLEKNKIVSLEDLNYHINHLNELYSKDREQELKCQMEGKEFQPEYELYKEMSFLSKSQGPFLCSICKAILPRYHPYCQHMAEHNDTQPYICPLCKSSFINYYKYLVHKKRHLGILDFHCKICGKGYMFKNDLEWHVTSHSGDKPYLCQICGAGFRARHHYNSHVRRHEQRFRHECHICKKGFNYLDNLKSHIKSHLNIRDVVCKICGKGFVHTKYLKRHELIHGEEKNFKCSECGKTFFQPSGLRAHRKNHHSS